MHGQPHIRFANSWLYKHKFQTELKPSQLSDLRTKKNSFHIHPNIRPPKHGQALLH